MKYLCTADLHLLADKPDCRLDDEDWLGVLNAKMDFIAEQARHSDAVIIAGDVFDSWRGVNFGFVNQCVKWFKAIKQNTKQQLIYTIAGNHDCPNHSYDPTEIDRSPYMTLVHAGVFHDLKLSPVDGFCVYCYTDNGAMPPSNAKICVAHKGLYEKKKPYPGASESGRVEQFVGFMPPSVGFIIAGDYHTPFHSNIRGIDVVNCGSLLRRRADQLDYKPCLWEVDVDSGIIEAVPIPLKNAIRRDYLDNEKEKNAMLQEMVGSIDGDFEVNLNYKDNFSRMAMEFADGTAMVNVFNRMLGVKK